MKWLLRLTALLVAALSSIFAAQWAVRHFYHSGRRYYILPLNKRDIYE